MNTTLEKLLPNSLFIIDNFIYYVMSKNVHCNSTLVPVVLDSKDLKLSFYQGWALPIKLLTFQ